jgi:hypothetical protein
MAGRFDNEEIFRICDFVAAPMCVFADGPGWVKLLFVVTEAVAAEVLARIELVRRQIDAAHIASTKFTLIHRYAATEQIEASLSLDKLSGTDEVLRQVFGLELEEEWQ